METVSHVNQIMNPEELYVILSQALLKRLISLRRCNNERVGKLYAFWISLFQVQSVPFLWLELLLPFSFLSGQRWSGIREYVWQYKIRNSMEKVLVFPILNPQKMIAAVLHFCSSWVPNQKVSLFNSLWSYKRPFSARFKAELDVGLYSDKRRNVCCCVCLHCLFVCIT